MSLLLPPFELHEPTTVEEAVRLKAEHPESDWIAGGTDLLPNYKWGLNTRGHVISLAKVDEMRTLSPTRLGALVTLRDVERSDMLREKLPVLPATAAEVASPLIRNSGTLGGNLMLENRCFFFNQSYGWRKSIDFCLKADGEQCHVVPQKETCYATFSADLPAPLIALDATYVLHGPDGRREVKAADFYTGDGIEVNRKKHDELLVEVRIPEEAQRVRAGYKKLRMRGSWDFPEMGIAAAVRLNEDHAVEQLRLVANALETAPRPLDELCAPLVGEVLTDARIEQLAQEVEQNVRPVKNTALPPGYRKAMTRPFTKRLLTELRDGKPVTPGPHHYSLLDSSTVPVSGNGSNGQGR